MNGEIKITNAKYIQNLNGDNIGIFCNFGGEIVSVPLDPANRHYPEIMRQVEAGELTIQDAN